MCAKAPEFRLGKHSRCHLRAQRSQIHVSRVEFAHPKLELVGVVYHLVYREVCTFRQNSKTLLRVNKQVSRCVDLYPVGTIMFPRPSNDWDSHKAPASGSEQV